MNEQAATARRPFLSRGGPILLVAFVLEALVAKGSIARLNPGLAIHLLATGVFLVVLVVAGELVPVDNLAGWNRVRLRAAAADVSVASLIAWGLLSAISQSVLPAANLAFFLLWATTYVVAFRSVPRLLAHSTPRIRLNLLSFLLAIGVAASVVVRSTWQGRFVGFFGNPTWSGLFFAAAVIHWALRAIGARSRGWLWLLAATLAAVLLVMTRTRAAILSAVLGLAFGLGYQLRHGAAPVRGRVRRVVLGGAYILAFLLAVAGTGDTDAYAAAAAHQLRLERGTAALYDSRGPLWQRGIQNFGHNGILGRGFLSKYGGTGQTRVIFGIQVPSYDWTTSSDPLNSLMLMDQQIGWIGALLFLAMLWGIWRAGVTAPLELRAQFIGFFVLGLITAFANGNWLVSFGDSFDRFSYLALAALAFAPSSRSTADDASPIPGVRANA